MVEKISERRRGRPLAFDPDAALDRAVEQFWRHGYEKTDVASIAAAVGVTKPSLYGQFGDKAALFARALERYGDTIGGAPLRAFDNEPDVRKAVVAFLETSVLGNTTPGLPSGCLIGCVAAAQAETMPDTRAFVRGVLAATEARIRERFLSEIRAGVLPANFDAELGARLVVDLMQANAVRARAGEARERLLKAVYGQSTTVLRLRP